MLLACPNNVKIYDLSSGKSLPEWISDRKRRKLLQRDSDLRRRIELIQDFDMPDCSNHVCMSKDGDYIFVSGVYKPRVRCYEVANLSLKFERCLDAEPLKLIPLSDGYEKFIVLEEDRWVEFHVQYGHYCKMRLPKFSRDAAYLESVGELYAAGSGSEVYRINLELGRLMPPLITDGTSLTACDANSFHQLFVVGSSEGHVEAWDPRMQKRVGKFEIAPQRDNLMVGADTSVSCLKFKDHLHLAAGTGWGQVYMFDIRSNAPLLVKDHNYDLPIKSIDFCDDPDMVLSLDSKVLKIWKNDSSTSTYASIEPGQSLNGLCLVPRTGMVFMPNEAQKVLTYYLPALGPAPRWCSFLDNIVEELEETEAPAIYDNYKFLTREELDQLGMTGLIGTKVLYPHMHGYYCHADLYNQVKATMQPFDFDEYRKKKIKEKMDEERTHRVIPVKKLPTVNRQLAQRLMEEEEAAAIEAEQGRQKLKGKKGHKKAVAAAERNLLKDERFRDLFENPEFQLDPDNEDMEVLNPVMSSLSRMKNKANKQKEDEREKERKRERLEFESKFANEGSDSDGAADSDVEEDDEDEADEDDDQSDDVEAPSSSATAKKQDGQRGEGCKKVVTLRSGEEFRGWKFEANKQQVLEERMASLGERVRKERSEDTETTTTNLAGNAKEMTFTVSKKKREITQAAKMADHVRERRHARRKTQGLGSKRGGGGRGRGGGRRK